jgi:hypothetical protein
MNEVNAPSGTITKDTCSIIRVACLETHAIYANADNANTAHVAMNRGEWYTWLVVMAVP